MSDPEMAIRGMTEKLPEDNILVSQDMPATATIAASEHISSSSAFYLTDRLPIFSYLVTSNRVRWYRIIMRTFLKHHRELYHYQLTAQEIRDAVRSTFDADYTLEQCQNDLAALKEWGNLTTIYDSSRATSIASFLSPALLYQATPEAIAIETFLDEQTRARAVRGSLRQGDLPRLWHSLQLLDEALRLPPLALTVTHSREMAEEWQRVFEVWNTMAHEAAQYLATMVNAAQHGQADLESYQAYKAAVVAYVQSFAQALTEHSRQIRTLLADWAATGKKERLIEIIAQYLEPPAPTREQQRSQADLLQEARNQVEALTSWFAARQHWLLTRDRVPIMPPASMRSRINCFKQAMERGPNNSSAPLLLISYLSIYRKAWQGPPVPHMIQGRAEHGKNLPPLNFICDPSAVLIVATIPWKIR